MSVLPRKDNPNKVAEAGWSHNEQVGRNQAIDDIYCSISQALEDELGVEAIRKIGSQELLYRGQGHIEGFDRFYKALHTHIKQVLLGEERGARDEQLR